MGKAFQAGVLFCMLVGCGVDRENSVKDVKTIELDGQTKLVVHVINGNVNIKGADSTDHVRVDITKKVKSSLSIRDAERHIPDIAVTAETNSSEVQITVKHPHEWLRDYTIDLTIVLPNRFDHFLDVRNGNLSLTATSRYADISVGNGTVMADISLQDSCRVSVVTGNGDITMKLPFRANAMLDVQVGSGDIRITNLPLRNRQESHTNLTGMLENGVGSIKLLTGNGDIEIKAK